ncbi:MAG TPA: LTA synthase family protein [Noviherbaspirillum sp.]|nr:LTA synthase family protein [Noviherbaspirillum sp.]
MSFISHARAGLQRRFGSMPLLLFFVFLVASCATRLALLAGAAGDVDWAAVPGSLALGFAYDIAAGLWAIIPVLFLHLVLPQARFLRPFSGALKAAVLAIAIYLLLFNLVAEVLFWQEFGVRYNFIAVDYLVYTHEVIGNIRESYPVGKILGALLVLTAALLFFARKTLVAVLAVTDPFARRVRQVLSWSVAIFAGWLCSGLLSTEAFRNQYNGELAVNGLYSFAAAFRNNELDYARFYKTLPTGEVFRTLGHLVAPDTTRIEQPRAVKSPAPEKRLNVVLISVESLSADFLAAFGNRRNLTPNLDRLANEGLLFTRLYATGTRTVRGLEALTLSLPPTPGQSIVKRPDNAHMFSLGSVFQGKGYDVRYAYGGYGYFDNMNAFFGNNGYRVVDRVSIPSERIPFENIWGVADEALFDQVLDEIDESFRAGKPSFTHVMTTSNHRPFTYPDGRIDIPSHTGREGGVKYTDYAIGRFFERARSKAWFHDTVFVIVADHCASSAGKTELPVERYHIPMIVYAPAHIRPGKVDRLASQIDAGPTLLGLLDFSYPTRFLGRDILNTPEEDDRAFISNYQALGYLKKNVLTVLRPKRQVAAYRVDGESRLTSIPVDQSLLREAIAYYQGAAELYKGGLYRNLP